MIKGLTFDDVLLVPQRSNIRSRSEVDVSTKLAGMSYGLDIPILTSNMDTITELDMALTMGRLGGGGVLHRYVDPTKVMEWIAAMHYEDVNPIIPSVGIGKDDLENAVKYASVGECDIVCVDVAHGHHTKVIEFIKELKHRLQGHAAIMAGNVATAWGFIDLVEAGADIVKVGVGSGGLCSTRLVTGHGVPQLTAIMNAAEARNNNRYAHKVSIVADGGIRNSGDIVKALAAGADCVMIGSLVAGTKETPGVQTFDQHGNLVKKFRGMASRDAQVGWRGSVHNDAPEGEDMLVPFMGPVEPIIRELVGGIRSGLSYSGCANLNEFREAAEFIEVTPLGFGENGPHRKTGR